MKRLLYILEQYEVFYKVNKKEQPKGNTFINRDTFLASRKSIKIVLDARYLNSLIDESKHKLAIEPNRVNCSQVNRKYFTTADMNSAYKQMPLEEQSRRLTQFVFGNQHYLIEYNRLEAYY